MSDPRRLIRLAAGTLLLSEKSLHEGISKAVNAHIARVTAEVAHQHAGERRAAILGLLLMGAKAMASDVRLAILNGRTEARDASRARLNAELMAAGMVLESHQWTVGHRGEEDDAHATSSADSLASQWRGMAMAAVLLARRRETSPSVALDATEAKMKARVDRTASSEAAQAYGDEHRTALREIVHFDRTYRDGELADAIEAQLGRQWSALLDACERCAPLDGEIVGINESFSGGEEPGFVHSRCRCTETVVPLEASVRRAA